MSQNTMEYLFKQQKNDKSIKLYYYPSFIDSVQGYSNVVLRALTMIN